MNILDENVLELILDRIRDKQIESPCVWVRR